MIAVCIHNRGSQLADHQRGRFGSFEQTYDLTIGSSYHVLGMTIFETVLCLLVQDDWGLPSFAPAGLFDCPDQPLPSNWRFSLRHAVAYSGRDLWTHTVAVWGYEELVSDPSHMEDLENGDQHARQTFIRAVRAAQDQETA